MVEDIEPDEEAPRLLRNREDRARGRTEKRPEPSQGDGAMPPRRASGDEGQGGDRARKASVGVTEMRAPSRCRLPSPSLCPAVARFLNEGKGREK